ncbi:hypothetical protein Tco_1045997, partial [Tanacetum coccineum]
MKDINYEMEILTLWKISEEGDFHHWLDLFNHFDTYFEIYIKPRRYLHLEDDFLKHDPPFPRESVFQILSKGAGADVVAHGCTRKEIDQESYKTLISKSVVPWREWDITGRR